MRKIKSESASVYNITGASVDSDDEILRKAEAILLSRMVERETLSSSSATRQFLKVRMSGKVAEQFDVVFLDNQHRVIAVETLFHGTIDGAAVYPREVIRATLNHNAAAVIFCHNHPSGIAAPSQADIAITRKLKTALQAIEARVLDHIIIGNGEMSSLAELNMI